MILYRLKILFWSSK